VCAVGCFSVLPCPALLVVCANLPTFRLVGLSAFRLVGKLESWRVGGVRVVRRAGVKRCCRGRIQGGGYRVGGLAAIRVPLLLDGWWVGSRGEEVGAGVAVYPGVRVRQFTRG